MTKILWSSEAANDLEAIRDFIARDSEHYARLVAQRIIVAIDLLATNPRMGRQVPELQNPEIREIIVGAYRVVYRCNGEAVEIATIFHGSRLFRHNDI